MVTPWGFGGGSPRAQGLQPRVAFVVLPGVSRASLGALGGRRSVPLPLLPFPWLLVFSYICILSQVNCFSVHSFSLRRLAIGQHQNLCCGPNLGFLWKNQSKQRAGDPCAVSGLQKWFSSRDRDLVTVRGGGYPGSLLAPAPLRLRDACPRCLCCGHVPQLCWGFGAGYLQHAGDAA